MITVMKHYLLSVAAATLVAVAAGTVVTVFAPLIEARVWPALTGVTFQVVSRDSKRMTLDWAGNRGRENCLLKVASATVRRGGKMVPTDLSPAGGPPDDPLPMVTRPPGWQQLRRLDVVPSGSAIAMHLTYACHPLWPSVTHIAEVALP